MQPDERAWPTVARSHLLAWLAVGVGLGWTGPAAQAQAQPQESCIECHAGLRDPHLRDPVRDLAASVHADRDVGCADCHGGNPEERTVRAHDRARGFRSRIETGSMPETCGTCHADQARFAAEREMPTDQLRGYLSSVHGAAFIEGNEKSASCWDCHGHHLVLSPEDERSTVHPANVRETCGDCHASEQVMAGSELPTDQARQWQASVHGQVHAEWIAAGRQPLEGHRPDRPPTCNDCHGEHAVARGERAVEACTGCHDDAWEAFRAGPHAAAFEAKGFLPCVECHGSHEVKPAHASLLGVVGDAACRRCHREGQEMVETIEALAQAETVAERAAAEARRALEEAPAEQRAQSLRLLEAREHALRIAAHTLDEERIVAAATELEELAGQLRARTQVEVEEEDELAIRTRVLIIGGGATLTFALLALVLWSRRRS